MLCKIAAHLLVGVQQQDLIICFYLVCLYLNLMAVSRQCRYNLVSLAFWRIYIILWISSIPDHFETSNSQYVVRQERKARQWRQCVESRVSLSLDWQLVAWRAVIAVAQTHSTVPFCNCCYTTLDTRRQRTTLNSPNSTVSVYFVCVLCCVNLLIRIYRVCLALPDSSFFYANVSTV